MRSPFGFLFLCRRWSKSVGFRCLVKAAALMVLM